MDILLLIVIVSVAYWGGYALGKKSGYDKAHEERNNHL